MVAIVENLVEETSTSTGATNFVLDGAINARISFNTGFGFGAPLDVFFYSILHNTLNEFEMGTGHLSDAVTLVRDTVLFSSNGGAAVIFSAGGKAVLCPIEAADFNAIVAKLATIETNAKDDQTDAEIETAYNAQVAVVSQAIAEAGTDTIVRRWTAQRVKQAVVALAPAPANVIGRNKLINGDFIVSRRATVFNGESVPANDNGEYTIDRCVLLVEQAAPGEDSVDFEQITTGLPLGARAAAKFTVIDGTKQFGCAQIIEARDCRDLISDVCSFSMQIKLSAGIAKVRVAILEWTGTEDDPTKEIITTFGSGGTEPTYATSWARIGTITDITTTGAWLEAEILNAAVGASMKNIAVVLWVDDATTTAADTVEITQWQLERGAITSIFEQLSFSVEQEKCKRFLPFFDITAASEALPGFGLSNSATVVIQNLPFSTEARVTPTGITVSDPNSFEAADGIIVSEPITAIAQSARSPHNSLITATTVNRVIGRPGFILSTAAAHIYFTGCELGE